MANNTLPMIKLKRIIQLKEAGCNKSSISKQLSIHRASLDKYLARINATGKSPSELLSLSDSDLNLLINPPSKPQSEDPRLSILKSCMDKILVECTRNGVTLKGQWEEYIIENPEQHYGYTQFCEHISRYKAIKNASMHFEHIPGRLLEVDYAGAKIPVYNRLTGEPDVYCWVMVCSFPFSSMSYLEAMETATQENLFMSLNRALRYFGGVPLNVKSDNMRQFITKNNRYEFSFTELGDQWSLHYNTSLAACRSGKPKDKPVVEGSVKIAYYRIFAKIRNEKHYTLDSLNKRLYELIEAYNDVPFQKRPGTRRSQFEQYELEHLKPLPATEFSIKHKVTAKVQMNYHIILGEDNHQYSVPFKHIGKKVSVIYDMLEVEIFFGLERIAIHPRNRAIAQYSTIKEHMPLNHQKQHEANGWDADHFLRFAASVGINTEQIFSSILKSRSFIEQNYKACIGLKQLTNKYGKERMEAACGRALPGKHNYGVIKNILEKGLDQMPDPLIEEITNSIYHANIRGKKYYNEPS